MSSPILNQLNFPQSRYESNKYTEILLIPVLKLLRRKVEKFSPAMHVFSVLGNDEIWSEKEGQSQHQKQENFLEKKLI